MFMNGDVVDRGAQDSAAGLDPPLRDHLAEPDRATAVAWYGE